MKTAGWERSSPRNRREVALSVFAFQPSEIRLGVDVPNVRLLPARQDTGSGVEKLLTTSGGSEQKHEDSGAHAASVARVVIRCHGLLGPGRTRSCCRRECSMSRAPRRLRAAIASRPGFACCSPSRAGPRISLPTQSTTAHARPEPNSFFVRLDGISAARPAGSGSCRTKSGAASSAAAASKNPIPGPRRTPPAVLVPLRRDRGDWRAGAGGRGRPGRGRRPFGTTSRRAPRASRRDAASAGPEEPGERHAERVRRALEEIAKGDVYVVNIARRFRLRRRVTRSICSRGWCAARARRTPRRCGFGELDVVSSIARALPAHDAGPAAWRPGQSRARGRAERERRRRPRAGPRARARPQGAGRARHDRGRGAQRSWPGRRHRKRAGGRPRRTSSRTATRAPPRRDARAELRAGVGSRSASRSDAAERQRDRRAEAARDGRDRRARAAAARALHRRDRLLCGPTAASSSRWRSERSPFGRRSALSRRRRHRRRQRSRARGRGDAAGKRCRSRARS